MIERIYVDNFRTLVNCEVKLTPVSLLLGPNGSGESTLFDVVDSIKRFVGGVALVSDLFPATELTRWQTLDEQTFEIDLRGDAGLFRYALKLKHEAPSRRSRVLSERLMLDGHPEVIDRLAGDKGIWLTRESAGPTRVEVGKARDTAPLKPSEMEARGW